MLSYHHLPSHLKRCFMYCSILPEDYEFEEQQLILLWMAEGLIQPPRKGISKWKIRVASIFKICCQGPFSNNQARRNHNLRYPGYSSNHSSMKKPRFVMHDLINDLAQRVAGDICFRMEDGIWGSNGRRLPKKFDTLLTWVASMIF
jgi:hypothetical protein